jgi:hypothetical protein
MCSWVWRNETKYELHFSKTTSNACSKTKTTSNIGTNNHVSNIQQCKYWNFQVVLKMNTSQKERTCVEQEKKKENARNEKWKPCMLVWLANYSWFEDVLNWLLSINWKIQV